MTTTPRDVLRLLLEGNARFVAGAMQHAHQDPEYRSNLSDAQHPIAAVLGCSDSRVPPELIFDQGLGDLFVVRNAGNLPMGAAIGSLEYSVAVLTVQLIVVLGHSNCGAVTAAVEGHEAPGQIKTLVNAVNTAIGDAGDISLDNAIVANIRYTVKQLSASEPVLAERVRKGTLRVVGAYYNLKTGLVTEVPVD